MPPQKLCFRRYIVHLPDLMAAFIQSYEKNVKESVENQGCLSNRCKVILYSHDNDSSKYNYNAKIQNKMKLFHLIKTLP